MVEKTISMKNEFDVKEKETAEFTAALGGKAVYLDGEKKKYVLASKDELNKLVKDAYAKNDYIKANELLESAKNIFGKDIKKELREIVSKSMRLKMNIFLALLNEAYNLGISVSDVVRKKIVNQLKENLKSIDTTPENKSLLEESLRLWADKTPIMHKEEYSDTVLIGDVKISADAKRIFDKDILQNNSDQKLLDELFTPLSKRILENHLESLGFSKADIKRIMTYFTFIAVTDELEYSIMNGANKKSELLLLVELRVRYHFTNIHELINSDLSKYQISEKLFCVLDDDADECVFDESAMLRLGIILDSTSEYSSSLQIAVQPTEFIFNVVPEPKNFRFIEIKDINILESTVLKNLFNINLENLKSLKKERENHTNTENYELAQEINNQLLYVDGCRKVNALLINALFSYLMRSKVVSITIPKGLLLWFNSLGGDSKIFE